MSDDPVPVAPPPDSPWGQLQSLRAAGVPRAQWVPHLVSSGLDEESARVLVNSVDGVTPARLPEPSFAPGINPLARSFAFTELGLDGPPATVGLYWLAFGATILLLLGLFSALVALDLAEPGEGVLPLVAWTMGTTGGLSVTWGVWRLFGAVTVRRR